MKNILKSLCLSVVIFQYSFAIENPYQLITDADFADSLNDIEALWQQAERGTFIGEDNISVAYRIFQHPDEKAAIVVSTGLTETFIKYKELIYSLYQQGYSLYIHDHRGQGFSQRMVASDSQMAHVWKFDDYVEDLKTFYQLKVVPQQHDKVFLLAHSMGGGIASLYLQKYPQDFIAAAMSSPMHEPDTGLLGGAACTGAKLTTRTRDIFIKWFKTEPRYALGQGRYQKPVFQANSPELMTHSELRYNYLAELYEQNDEVKIGGISSHWLANACRASKKLLKHAGKTQIPVLVLQAGEDIIVTAEGQNKYCEQLSKANGGGNCVSGAPVVIDGAYHELFIESDEYRIRAVTEILDFFNAAL